MDWRSLKVGDEVVWKFKDPLSPPGSFNATVTIVEDDHALAIADDLKLWIDDDTVYQFERR